MTHSDPNLAPVLLIAELTHRCPLGCPYCSNPLTLEQREDELDAATWARVFREAVDLGVLHVHLSGGEPGARRDLVDIVAHAREAGLTTHLVTSGVGITARTLRDLWEAGLEHVQVSFQDADAVSADRIADHRGAFQRKHAFAAEAVRLGLPLAINMVVHRANIEHVGAMVDLAVRLGATRIELAHVAYEGWARKNMAALMPDAEQVSCAAAEIEELRHRFGRDIAIAAPIPGGQACPDLNVAPSGWVLPNEAARSIPGLQFWNVLDHSLAEIWASSPAFHSIRATNLQDALGMTGKGGPIADLAAVQEGAAYAYRRM